MAPMLSLGESEANNPEKNEFQRRRYSIMLAVTRNNERKVSFAFDTLALTMVPGSRFDGLSFRT